jgi:hypothetical protein
MIKRKLQTSYVFTNSFKDMDQDFLQFALIQLVDFPRWLRPINNVLEYAHHCFASNQTSIQCSKCLNHIFSDGNLIIATNNKDKPQPELSLTRSWLRYRKEKLISQLGKVSWKIDNYNAQSYGTHLKIKFSI